MKKYGAIVFIFALALGVLGFWFQGEQGGNRHPSSAGEAPSLGAFVSIPAGRFTMGSPRRGGDLPFNNDDEVQVEVEISRPFSIMATEVTQLMWFGVMGRNPSDFYRLRHCPDSYAVIVGREDLSEVGICPHYPVESVSWHDIQDFIAKLNAMEKRSGCDGTPKSPKGCYRLPTEAEWEYAARAGSDSFFSFGDDLEELGDFAVYRENSGLKEKRVKLFGWTLFSFPKELKGQTHRVGTKRSNPWGLYNMHGNVREWVQDSYGEKLIKGKDPLRNSGKYRVLRGGGWSDEAWGLRSAKRYYSAASSKTNYFGFRLVRAE